MELALWSLLIPSSGMTKEPGEEDGTALREMMTLLNAEPQPTSNGNIWKYEATVVARPSGHVWPCVLPTACTPPVARRVHERRM